MSKFRIWITADELMKRLGIGPLDLVDYVLEKKLTACNSNKTPIDLDYEQKSLEDKLAYWKAIYGEPTHLWIGFVDLSSLEHRIVNYIFKLKEVVELENKFIPVKVIKLRCTQRHKEECRQIAKSIWDIMPDITIVGMIRTDEIRKIRGEKKPNPYTERTVREWVNDLCPNRKPGRRPKQK